MSNDNKNMNMNDRGNSGKNDAQRGNEGTQKAAQQSQDASRHQQDAGHHQIHKSPQQGASDNKSAQQSQGVSHKDSGDTKRSGSGNVAHDQKHANEAGQKSGASK
jgi:hypothetical protein